MVSTETDYVVFAQNLAGKRVSFEIFCSTMGIFVAVYQPPPYSSAGKATATFAILLYAYVSYHVVTETM